MSPTAVAPAPAVPDAVRARLRADVALAARVLPVARPLADFVAVNPLNGFEDLDVPTAVEAAAELFGIVGHLGEPAYRQALETGRITPGDLRAALAAHLPGSDLDARVAPRDGDAAADVTVADCLVADLRHAPPAPPTGRTVLSPAERHDRRHGSNVADAVDAHVVRWCAAHLDRGQASWSLARHGELFATWRGLVRHDRSLPRAVRRRLSSVPERPEDAVLVALEQLGVEPDRHLAALRAELTRQPGWAAHLRWRAEAVGDVALVDLVALRLSLAAALAADAPAPTDGGGEPAEGPADVVEQPAVGAPSAEDTAGERAAAALGHLGVEPDAVEPAARQELLAALAALPPARRPWVWHEAYERHYRRHLLAALSGPPRPGPLVDARPRAQVVCCIDVRSEGLRRHLEAAADIETLGFAGFFAVAVNWHDLAGGEPLANCPALITPRHDVAEVVVGSRATGEAHRRRTAAMGGADDGIHDAKVTPGAPFALAEAAGWVTGPLAGLRTAAPAAWGRLRRGVVQRASAAPPTRADAAAGMSLADRVLTARTALTMMGLTTGFAPLVVLCGHTSETEANPYEAGLRCGACGGHGGGPNARVLAAVLNDPEVRAQLAGHGIELPADTVVVAAEHDTTSDVVTVLDRHLVPAGHLEALDHLEADLARAGRGLAAERCATLPGAPTDGDEARRADDVARRGADWAETFPEWGLAGNAAFVIGPRAMTRGLDLQRRVFLHSYDAVVDADGSGLETILTAPLVVAQMINSQYWLSTTDPDVLGAGTKTVHNPVGDIGVVSGRTGDLRLGLPLQSVAGGGYAHEPLRLLAVVEAPRDRIAAIVDRNPGLRDLLAGGWLTMVARDEPGATWYEWSAQGWRAAPAPTTEDQLS